MGNLLVIKGADFSENAIDSVEQYNQIGITFDSTNQVAGKSNDYHNIWVDNPFEVGKTYKIITKYNSVFSATSKTAGTASSAFKVSTTNGESETAVQIIIAETVTGSTPIPVPNNSPYYFTCNSAATKLNFFTQRSNVNMTEGSVSITFAYREVESE